MRIRIVCFTMIAGMVLASIRAEANTVTINSGRDNTLYEDGSGLISNGSGEYFFSGRTGQPAGSIRRGLVWFDIAGSIPATATIQSVQLTLHMSKTSFFAGAHTHTINAVLEDWGEGASNDLGNEGGGTLATTDDATWIYTFYDTASWSIAGGFYSLTSSASRSVNAVGFYTWGTTAQMVADVQGWLDDPSTNFGWVVLGNEGTSTTAKRFDARENLITANRPKLVVQYDLAPAPPILDPIGPQSVDEGQSLNVVVTSSDPNQTIPQLQAQDLPANAQFSDNNNGTGNFTFDPDYLQAGVYNVRFISSDGTFADTELVAVTVSEITDPPTAADDLLATPEEQDVASFFSATDPDSDTLTYAVVDGPLHGALTAFDPATGGFTYLPAVDFNGEDTVRFTANDGNATSNIGVVRLTVSPVNDPPVAGDVNIVVVVNVPVGVGAMPVTDVDNVSATISHTAGPFHGTVSAFNPATGSFTYTPETDYVGPDSIKYVADDGQDPSNTATVRLDIADGCACPFQGDMNADNQRDPVDLNGVIDALFFAGANPQDASCPTTRADFNADGMPDPVDLNALIDYLFFAGPLPTDPCAP